MSPRTETPTVALTKGVPRNAVTLSGRVSAEVAERTLPSGDVLLTTRVTVERDATAEKSGSSKTRQRSDAIECVVWSARVQRTVRRWQPGDLVHIEGAIRRRFFTGANGTASRVEVEVMRARRLSPAQPTSPRTPPEAE